MEFANTKSEPSPDACSATLISSSLSIKDRLSVCEQSSRNLPTGVYVD